MVLLSTETIEFHEFHCPYNSYMVYFLVSVDDHRCDGRVDCRRSDALLRRPEGLRPVTLVRGPSSAADRAPACASSRSVSSSTFVINLNLSSSNSTDPSTVSTTNFLFHDDQVLVKTRNVTWPHFVHGLPTQRCCFQLVTGKSCQRTEIDKYKANVP